MTTQPSTTSSTFTVSPSVSDGNEAAAQVRARLDALPDWALSEMTSIGQAVRHLTLGWIPVHAVAFFGEDTAVLMTDGAGWAVTVYHPHWVVDVDHDVCADFEWESAPVTTRRVFMEALAERFITAPSLVDLLTLVGDFVYLTDDEADLSLAVEALVTVIAEWATQTGDSLHWAVEQPAVVSDLLGLVTETQDVIAEDVLSDQQVGLMTLDEFLLGVEFENTLAARDGESGPDKPNANVAFQPRGCDLHHYPAPATSRA